MNDGKTEDCPSGEACDWSCDQHQVVTGQVPLRPTE